MFDLYSLAVCMWGIAVPLAAGTFLLDRPVLFLSWTSIFILSFCG